MPVRKEIRSLITGFEKRLERELPERIGSGLSDFKIKEEGTVAMRIARDSILKACRIFKDQYSFDHFSCLSAVDWGDKFELVYHLTSYENFCIAEIRVDVPKTDTVVDSVTPLWGGANWHEREAYDLMGIAFKGHPNLTRILLPKDYKYHPLRKDFPFKEGG